MRLTVISDELPRTVTETRDVPCDEALHPPVLRVEVRCESISAAREDELLRLACAQRLEHLRARLSDVGEVCRATVGAKGTLLC